MTTTTTWKCCGREHPANGVKCCVCGERRSDYAQKDELIYLAAPFTAAPELQIQRQIEIEDYTVRMILDGVLVFSPIAFCANIWIVHSVKDVDPYEWDLRMLRKCDRLVVLMLDGWRESKGVGLEIAEAERLGMPIEYREV